MQTCFVNLFSVARPANYMEPLEESDLNQPLVRKSMEMLDLITVVSVSQCGHSYAVRNAPFKIFQIVKRTVLFKHFF